MVLDVIVEQALQGQAKQQELFLKYAGLLVDRRVTEKVVSYTDIEELSDEELQEAWQAEWDEEAAEIFNANDLEELDNGDS
jgi:hypothetical protein